MSDDRRSTHSGIHTSRGLGKIFSRRNLTRAGATLLLLGLLGGGGWLLAGSGAMDKVLGGKNVDFAQLDEKDIPQAIVTDVIPEYRELERALGCLADGKVYVVVTRGEKPTAGFGLEIEGMKLEKTDHGQNLVVTALFTDPPEGEAVAQVITYPVQVAETQLTQLPDTIELRTVFK